MSRNDYLLPDGWSPARGGRVKVIETKADPEPPPGTYRLIERAPIDWWAQPVDDDAKAWCAAHPNAVTQGCLQLATSRVVPPQAELRVGGER